MGPSAPQPMKAGTLVCKDWRSHRIRRDKCPERVLSQHGCLFQSKPPEKVLIFTKLDPEVYKSPLEKLRHDMGIADNR